MGSASGSGGSLTETGRSRMQHAPFRETTVLVCGFSACESEELVCSVQAMGGNTQTRFHLKALPHVAVCGCTLDEHYRVRASFFCEAGRGWETQHATAEHAAIWLHARARHAPAQSTAHAAPNRVPLTRPMQALVRVTADVPVVTRAWLDACAQQQAQVPVDAHRAGPFTGLVVCTTNFNLAQRQDAEVLVKQGGGAFSPELQKGVCTHLVCGKPDGQKYK